MVHNNDDKDNNRRQCNDYDERNGYATSSQCNFRWEKNQTRTIKSTNRKSKQLHVIFSALI